MSETWMISNRQPWPYALITGLIRTKTRSLAVSLPPIGATVYLHASKALWSGWKNLWWVRKYGLYVPGLHRGGVVGVARVKATGLTPDVMPKQDRRFFRCDDGHERWSCAAPASIVFEDVRPMPFIPCRGAQVPTRKLPPELQDYLSNQANCTEFPTYVDGQGREHAEY